VAWLLWTNDQQSGSYPTWPYHARPVAVHFDEMPTDDAGRGSDGRNCRNRSDSLGVSRTVRHFLLGFAGLVFSCAFALPAAQNSLWTLNLNASAGYRSAALYSLQQSRRVVILDDNNLLVLSSFLHDNSSTGFLVLVDGSTGLITKSLALGDLPGAMTAGRGFDVARLGGNRFLVAIGDDLRLGVSPELNWVQSLTIPRRAKSARLGDRGRGRLYASPSGKTVFLEQYYPGTSHWVDPDSLATRDASTSPVTIGIVGLTDREFVGNIAERGGDAPSVSAARQPFGESTARRLCGSCRTKAIFGHDWIVLSDSLNIWIADHEGHVRYRDPRKIDPRSVVFAGSSMTDRIAFTYLNLRRDRDMYLVNERVAVFDAAQKKDVFSTSLNLARQPFPMRFGLPRVELMLSPDGKRLAVLRDNVLRYFVLN
jgi:hypothetical protein